MSNDPSVNSQPLPQAYADVPYYIDALLSQDINSFWNYGNGQAVTLSFSFPDWYYTGVDLPSSSFTEQEKTYVRQALAAWSAATNINFAEVSAGSAANPITANIEIRKAQLPSGEAGLTYFPHSVSNGVDVGGSVYIDTDTIVGEPGTFGFETILHELGHALGLKHPGPYNAGGGTTEPPYLPSDQDNTAYTVMSYTAFTTITFGTSVPIYSATPMLDDIAAIQYVYGARASHTGNDTYRFDVAGKGEFRTIWDTGGTDTIDGSGDINALIDLNPGSISGWGDDAGYKPAIIIAYNTWIENALGTWGNDTIIGNGLDNIIRVNGDSDWIDQNGVDEIDGGGGYDTVVFSGLVSSYTIQALTDATMQYTRPDGTTATLVFDGTGVSVQGHLGATTLAHVERLVFSDATVFLGGPGNDVLMGSTGADILIGGLGNDTYVYASGDTIIEGANAGFDTVNSYNSYTLGANIERVLLLGNANTNATGNGLDNVLLGNAGNNILDGGPGHDTMQGGAGNDTYVYATGDTIIEGANAGFDTVNSYNSYTLGANIDRVLLLGNANTNATGNGLDNVLLGNVGNNILDGGAGHDTMQGGVGNDTYVYATGDTIVEAANAGFDTVNSYNSYTLGANIERVLLLGNANTNATGNGLDNVLIGNAGNNILSGQDGNDTLRGGLGIDTLIGGNGADHFQFDTAPSASNVKIIQDFQHLTDKIVLENAIFTPLTTTGPLNVEWLRVGDSALEPDDYLVYHQSNGNLIYDPDGNGGNPGILIVNLATHPALTAADFLVV